jgi:Xaa-Pro aminopeptidase
MELGGDQRLGLAYDDVVALFGALPRMKATDVGPLITALRAVKSSAEIEAIRTACTLSDQAWIETLAVLRPGQDLAEIRAELGAALCRAGCDVNVVGHVTVALGEAGRTVSRPGDILWADFGGTVGGYQADIARRAVFGPASERDLATHEQISELVRAQMEAVRPGVPAATVARACTNKLEELGFPGLAPKKRVGHGLGLGPAEPPSLNLVDETILEPGMVLCIEPRFEPAGQPIVHLEDVVVVTESGYEQLSHGATELRVIEL